MSAVAEKKREIVPMNGVDTPNLFATINVVKGQPELAKFTFRASNRWETGTYSKGRIESFSGAGGDHTHEFDVVYEADHPKVLVGEDRAPLPVEYLLLAITSCLTSGIANIAAARGIKLTSVESRVEADMDLRGILGLSDTVRNGYDQMRVAFDIQGDATEEQLRQIVAQSKARSAVFDVLSNGTTVDVAVNVK